MQEFIVKSVNISKKKGVIKIPVESAKVNSSGIENDAHAGKWHRQISLLAEESIRHAESKAGKTFPPGTFAENITTSGLELHKTSILDRFINEKIILEVTQIGKKCHSSCAIGKQIGDCIMPKEGIFCRVLKEGKLEKGMIFKYVPKAFKIKIITLSDRAFEGIYPDKSGPAISSALMDFFNPGYRKLELTNILIPDSSELLQKEIKSSLENNFDIIFTTGGTGIGEKDITPDTVKVLLTRELPGIMELIRVKYGMNNPNAALSRSIAGLIDKSLIYCLPGSVKAVKEYMTEIMPTLEHSIRMIYGIDSH